MEVEWGVFSLSIQNHSGDEPLDPDSARGVAALRTALAVRDRAGNEALGRFYEALGRQVFDLVRRPDDPEAISEALTAAGLDPSLRERALADPETWRVLQEEHRDLVSQTGAFGVPTIRLDSGSGPAIFGPVISNPPEDDEEALELWRHVAWLTRYGNFSELKRGRTIEPDLESIRERKRRQAEKERQAREGGTQP